MNRLREPDRSPPLVRLDRLTRDVALGLKTLALHKLRSFLTMLGIIFGVASVIAMLAIGEGASREALDRIRALGARNIIITSVVPVDDEGADPTRRDRIEVYGLKHDDLLRITETMSTVHRVVAMRQTKRLARLGERTVELRIVGTDETWFELVRRPLLAGRTLLTEDREAGRAVCVLTEHGGRKLLATTQALGARVYLGDGSFEIVGIVRSAIDADGVSSPDSAVDAYVPLDTFEERFGDFSREDRRMVEIDQLIVETSRVEDVEPTADAIRGMLERFHPRPDYRVDVPLTLLRQAEETKRTFNVVLGSIAGISLLVGGIGIMNIMLASVTERTREIGVRRAIGAKRRDIVSQFLIETTVLTVAGGAIGTVLGVLIPIAITHLAGMPTVVPAYAIVLAAGVSISVGVVFGLYPAVRAASLDPIEALRHE